jgi:hypothetical protein
LDYTPQYIPHVVLIGQSAKELGNNIHTAKVTYANSMEAAVNIASILMWMLLPSSLALCPIKTTWGIWLSINANKAL